MAATQYTTLLNDLLDPQVVADYIDKKLINGIRFSPLAHIDTSLVGRPGDEVSLPQYQYVGAAAAVAEGADIPIAKLTQNVRKVKISKIGRAIQFTDEALLSGYNNDIAQEAAKQVVVAINDKVEADLIASMGENAALTSTIAANADPADGIADALTQFGEDIDGEKVLVIPPAFYARLRKSKAWIPNTEIGADAIIRGTVGMVHGCQVVASNRLAGANAPTYALTSDSSVSASKTYYERDVDGRYIVVANPTVAGLSGYYERTAGTANLAYIVKPGGLAIFMKRDTLVEFDRDKIDQTNYIIGSKLFAPYVYDLSKVIKVTLA